MLQCQQREVAFLDTFGDRLKHLREELNLGRNAMAEALGVHPGHVAQIENNKRTPSDLLVKAISSRFFVSEAWLRTGEGPMMEPAADVIEKQKHLFGSQGLADSILDQVLDEEARERRLPFPWPPNEPIPIDAAELQRMVNYLISLWLAGDPRMRTWASVQFERAFPDSRIDPQKKPGDAEEGGGPRAATSS